jgi:hypothetical protein
MVSEFGGHALFARLTPRTAQWAALEVAREAARRTDAAARAKDANPDRLRSLFSLGFAVDEQLADRLALHKRSGEPPEVSLPERPPRSARRTAPPWPRRRARMPRPHWQRLTAAARPRPSARGARSAPRRRSHRRGPASAGAPGISWAMGVAASADASVRAVSARAAAVTQSPHAHAGRVRVDACRSRGLVCRQVRPTSRRYWSLLILNSPTRTASR